MRTRTRGRAISRLIEAHRAEFDALVAEERAHAEAWQRRLNRHSETVSVTPLDEPRQLRLSPYPHSSGPDRREARRRRVVAMWQVGATLDEMAEAADCSKRTIERITAAEGLRYGRGSSRRKVDAEDRRRASGE
jgi:ferric-dicitrate binding protein FerR (iron transport regulator)